MSKTFYPLLIKNNCIKIVISLICLISLLLSGCSNESPNNINNKRENNSTPQQLQKTIIKEVPNYTYSKMVKHLESLKAIYNLDIQTFGKSVYQRDLYYIKLGSGTKKIAVTAGVHGREGITSLLTMKLIEEYAKKYEQQQNIVDYDLKDLFNKVSFYFIPMLNPDGIEIAINGIKQNQEFFTKANEGDSDFSHWKSNGRGVDLNKQFPADWEEVESSKNAHYKDFKGNTPLSEPESKALASLSQKENFAAVVCFHNSGSIIYWYYNQKGRKYQHDYKLAKAMAAKNGYQLIEPEESDKKAAGYKDWFIKEFEKPGFTIEISDGKAERPLPSSQLSRYFQENKEVLLELAKKL